VSGAIDDGGAIDVDAAEGELLVSSRERMSTAA
jgi:hypothetical protein